MSGAQIKIAVFSFIAVVVLFGFGGQLVGKNDFGNYQVIQSVGGEITIRDRPGYYSQQFADVTTNKFTDVVYFSKSSVDGGESEESAQVEVQFADGSLGFVSGVLKYKIPTIQTIQKQIHLDYNGNPRGLRNLVRQIVHESLRQSASLFKPEEAYATRRSEFKSLAQKQIIRGLFDTKSVERTTTDGQGRISIEKRAELLIGDDGRYVVSSPSIFDTYKLTIIAFNVKDINFDDTVMALIAKKKEAEQAKIVAKAQAEEAKQNAITEKEKGKARIAKAKANMDVEKMTAVTKAEKNKAVAKLNAEREKQVFELNAERDYQVAKLNRKAASENAKAMLVAKEAEAKANELLVKAGLTPLLEAQINKETSIGVARELAKLKLPSTVISGGGGSSSGGLLFQAMGINQILELNEKLKKTNIKK